MIGQTISHYRIVEKLGEGGMGVLYQAIDTRLDRMVAIKVLRPDAIGSEERRQRFVREAKAASALNHSRIVTIHEIDQDGSPGMDRDFIVMEYLDGTSLDKRMGAQPFSIDDSLHYAVQIAEALAAAHAAGIVHRDVKPANVMVSKQREVKLVDFGLAKLAEPVSVDEAEPTRTAGLHTEAGAVLGTVAYMSPEQAEGKAVDARSDVFSFGSVLYEMLTGKRAFQGDSSITTRMAILSLMPPPVRSLRHEAPAELERIVSRCLEKRREDRFASGTELLSDLERFRHRYEATQASSWRRRRVVAPVALVLFALVGVGTWFWVRDSRVRWAHLVATPQIALLAEKEDYLPAYDLAREALTVLPGDRELERLWNVLTTQVSLQTDPPGAEVQWKPYADPAAGWRSVGRTPLASARLPLVYRRWRIEKEGFLPLERAGAGLGAPSLALDPLDGPPSDMVRVPRGQRSLAGRLVEVESYWLDKHEVTNRRFKEFADGGGYRKRELWKHPFVKQGREIPWPETLRELVDSTGRPGPATWEFGTYPQGQDDYPVRGVSWYEAAAYAEFTGKSLPTFHHWLWAVDSFGPPAVLELSNFDGQGPARVGEHQGLGPFGTLDMAGNVKEWCWNLSGDKRYIMGGAWNEPVYMYTAPHAQSPWDRAETHGFRCAKYVAPLPEQLTNPIESLFRDYTKERPVDDATFKIFESLYAYDRSDLRPVVEPMASGSPYWRKERVSFNAAYGSERVAADLFLPSNSSPPFQTVIYFPGSGALMATQSEDPQERYFDFLIRSGRAVVRPIYKGTYERRLPTRAAPGSRAERDLIIQWHKDLARSIDYLETRADIDKARLAYCGFSLGARTGLIHTALEPRFKASLLIAGGLDFVVTPAEVDPLNFAPRVKTPTLMLNGREDFRFPLEILQKPLFRILGTPERDKRHVLFPGGHIVPRHELIKPALEWLDRYLGPVETIG